MVSPSETLPGHLLARARDGSEGSLGKLMQLHADYLKLVVTSQLDDRLRQRVSASDVVQETFYEAHRDFPAFRGTTPEEFLGWIRRILMNNLLRAIELHVKAAKRDIRREVSLDRVQGPSDRSNTARAASLAQSGETPSACFERNENARTLSEMLDSLPEDYREVLRLRHHEGLDFSAIGDRMGRSSGAVRMLWLRGVKRLRSLYTERGEP
ncbi:MAG: sigma-70 family RNA polymerase sigma factor [Planctomycetota bacterium]